jgi:hypothetical protein
MHPVMRVIKDWVKPSFATNIQHVFIYSFIATLFGLPDGHPQVNRTKYSQNTHNP